MPIGFSSEGHHTNGKKYGDYLSVESGNKSEKETAIVRQKLLEIVLSWATDNYNRQYGRKITIDDYMMAHQHDSNALDLWRYYENVMEWVKRTFPSYRADMKGVSWGILYNQYHDTTPANANEMVDDIFEQASDEISNKKGVYEAVLSKDIKFIHARSFDKKDLKWAYNKQKGICPYCHRHFQPL